MIVTVTANPSMDRTITLGGPLVRGGVIRAESVTEQPGGKGVNVSRVIQLAGEPTVAVVPGPPGDPLLTSLAAERLPVDAIRTVHGVRSNITVTEPGGTTTKLNLKGTPLAADELDQVTAAILRHARRATWVALCGSVPPGTPTGWYRDLLEALKDAPCRTALDTSEHWLTDVAAGFPASAPDLLKPNAEELGSLTDIDGAEIEAAAAEGDLRIARKAAGALHDASGADVLLTLGAAGAVLVSHKAAWFATPPAITPRSTVGAGDASLAGYLLASVRGGAPAARLRTAVAYGTAAAALPGTTPPTTADVRPDDVTITELPES